MRGLHLHPARPRAPAHGLAWLLILLLPGCLFLDSRWFENRDQPVREALQPARLQPAEQVPLPRLRTFMLQIYADQDYRQSHLNWQRQVEQWVSRANEVVAPEFGCQFGILGLHTWERRAERTDRAGALTELQALDPAGADWIVGLVAPRGHVLATIDQLGWAYSLGRQLVVAVEHDLNEAEFFAQLDRLTAEERAKLYRDRKLHREVVVFLHEWGHNLGAVHSEHADDIMNPTYHTRLARFSPANQAIIRLALPQLPAGLQPGLARTAWLTDLRQLLASTPAIEFTAGERDQMLAFLQQELASRSPPPIAAAPPAPAAAPPAPSPPAPAPGPTAPEPGPTAPAPGPTAPAPGPTAPAAPGAHAPAATPAPTSPTRSVTSRDCDGDHPPTELLMACCRLGAWSRPPSPKSERNCQAARERHPVEPLPLLGLAHLRLSQQRFPEALLLLQRTEDLQRRSAHPDWQSLGALYLEGRWLQHAQAALARLPAPRRPTRLSQELVQLRRRLGLPAPPNPAAVTADAEQGVVSLLQASQELLRQGRFADAEARANQLLTHHPQLPGALSVKCEVQLRQQQRGAAERLCTQALQGFEETAHAHYLMARLTGEQNQLDRHIHHLRRLVQLRPELRPAWESLARALERMGRAEERDRLREEYRKAQGTPAPF